MEYALLFVGSGLGRLSARYIAVVIGLLVTTIRFAPAGAEATTWVAMCQVTMDVQYSSEVTATPGAATTIALSDPGGNTCFVQPGGLVDLTISSDSPLTLVDPPELWGCAAGLATGSIGVDLHLDGFPDPTVHAVVVNAGGVITMGLVSPDVVTFTGAATLVQEPVETVACAATPQTSTTWRGLLVFQDPVMSR